MGPLALKSLTATALLAFLPLSIATEDRGIFPAGSIPYGQTYSEWSGDWWRWVLEHPLAGHPAIDDPSFDVSSGQSGRVWFLATPLGDPVQRDITIRAGTALFVGLLNYEVSSNEWDPTLPPPTEAELRDAARAVADYAVMDFLTLDGVDVSDFSQYRCESPLFQFTAPDPWIFSPYPGGPGYAVADGYYVFLHPLSVGTHVLHYAGSFDFGSFVVPADVTYTITVVP